MSAIEYGSYYWCVLLGGAEAGHLGEAIHLHADEMSVDGAGTLLFKSAGRRPAGSDPKHLDGKEKRETDKNGEGSEGKDKEFRAESDDMVYVAFAAGCWKMVYAAKLQDGSAASVEHWKNAAGQDALPQAVAGVAAAAGYPAAAPAAVDQAIDPAIRK